MTDSTSEADEFATMPTTTRVVSLNGKLSDDQKRVQVSLELSDVSQRPDIELAVLDAEGYEIASSLILGVMIPVVEFTLHIRNAVITFPTKIAVKIRKDDKTILDMKLVSISQVK